MARKIIRFTIRNGRRYISLSFASSLCGYHKDYLGQLIRNQKLHGEKIGNAWFIEESEFEKFVETSAPEIIPPAPPAPVVIHMHPIASTHHQKNTWRPLKLAQIAVFSFAMLFGFLVIQESFATRTLLHSEYLVAAVRPLNFFQNLIEDVPKIFGYSMGMRVRSNFGSRINTIAKQLLPVSDDIVIYPPPALNVPTSSQGEPLSVKGESLSDSEGLPLVNPLEIVPEPSSLTPTERIVERIILAGLQQSDLDQAMETVNTKILSEANLLRALIYEKSNSNFQAIALTNKIDNLSGITLSSVTGLVDSDIPNNLTASNYLPLTGGTITSDLAVSGALTVSGTQTLSGALTIPYLTATSSTASQFIQASSTRLSVVDALFVGGTATTTIRGDNLASVIQGSLGIGTTTPAQEFSVQGDAYVSGSSFFGGAITATSTLLLGELATLQNGFISQSSSTVTANLNVGGPLSASSTLSVANELYVNGSGTSTIANNLEVRRLASWNWIETPQIMATSTTATSSIAYGLTVATSGGLVGIGTSTPNWKLQVAGTRPFLTLSDTSAGTDLKHWFFSSQGGNLYVGTTTDAYATSSISALTILNNGNIGIGTTSPGTSFQVGDTSNFQTGSNFTGSVFGGGTRQAFLMTDGTQKFYAQLGSGVTTRFGLLSNHALIFQTSGTDRMTIATDGTISMDALSSGASVLDDLCINGGVLTINTTNDCNSASSVRYKENIADLSYGIDEVMRLNPIFFNYIPTYAPDPKDRNRKIGFIAEDMELVIPEVVEYDEEGLPSGIDYQNLTALLTKAIQEQQGEIEGLKAALASTTIQDLSSQNLEASLPSGSEASSLSLSAILDYILNAFRTLAVEAREFAADTFRARQLCLENVCVTRDELQILLNNAGLGASDTEPPVSGTTTNLDVGLPSDTEPPVITILGANPAEIEIGSIYGDLGATVTDNVDTNLGVYASLDGGAEMQFGEIQLDTSMIGEHSIIYRASDTAGNTATTTRAVIVFDPAAAQATTTH